MAQQNPHCTQIFSFEKYDGEGRYQIHTDPSGARSGIRPNQPKRWSQSVAKEQDFLCQGKLVPSLTRLWQQLGVRTVQTSPPLSQGPSGHPEDLCSP